MRIRKMYMDGVKMKIQYIEPSEYSNDLGDLEFILSLLKDTQRDYTKGDIIALLKHLSGHTELVLAKVQRVKGTSYFGGKQ